MRAGGAVHDLALEGVEPEGIDTELAVRNYLLFAKLGDEVCAVTSERYLGEAANCFSKLAEHYTLTLIDEPSFERLYNRFLEFRNDRAISSIQEGPPADESADDAFSLTEFLRTSSDILTSEESAPIIRFVNALFYQAIKKGASDIHIETHERQGEVRFRIDGILHGSVDLDKAIIALIISRIKVISHLDISEKRIPQDGRTQVKIAGETLDVRVSILPTYHGERVVMRLLMQGSQIPSVGELGLPDAMTDAIRRLLRAPHGIILVTGPTGSGKSTSLHAFLKAIESEAKNLITVEDPVEYKSDTISQIQVNEKVGLTFATALRSILRQDPDVIMVGEIRDEETARIAVRAALTGHLVFSTLHTSSAAATLSRLADMGIAPFLIASSLLGVLAQRLVRILCEHCKRGDLLARDYAADYALPADQTICQAAGCPACHHTGYTGRRPVG